MLGTKNKYYTYLWLREDGTPYYVGKGHGNRAFTSFSHGVVCPPEDSRIIVQEFDSEEQAFEAEKFLVVYFGRKDLGTGSLRNLTNGGENPPNHTGRKQSSEEISKRIEARHRNGTYFITDETREKMRAAKLGRKQSSEQVLHAALTRIGNTWSRKAAHVRWHTDRNIFSSDCRYCHA